MKITLSSTIQSLILAAALSAELGFVSPVSAQQHSYIVDLNSKNVTALCSLGTGDTIVQPGRWWAAPTRPDLEIARIGLPLSPALMEWA